jgi:hypothetical protein
MEETDMREMRNGKKTQDRRKERQRILEERKHERRDKVKTNLQRNSVIMIDVRACISPLRCGFCT